MKRYEHRGYAILVRHDQNGEKVWVITNLDGSPASDFSCAVYWSLKDAQISINQHLVWNAS